ncbi:hypothetical protein J5N97_000800 [Dioscorea zingiberensis]|uniref:Uncharacterized protein n=1 Tax=Dioscorea zingiberensis TaxID=325984 RepID=A0A9D5BV24_9LILI|nr:hypothetical protein J5N97_000800 [Dioscorea zingiberensis]
MDINVIAEGERGSCYILFSGVSIKSLKVVCDQNSRKSMAEESKKGAEAVATDIYNVEAAEILANEALHLPISESLQIYEQLLSTFPTAAKLHTFH